MLKPALGEYGLTDKEYQQALGVDDKLPIWIFIVMFCVVIITHGISTNPIVFVMDALLYFSVAFVLTLVALIPASFLIGLFWPRYRQAKKYEKAHDAYKRWWIRTQKDFWLSLSGRQFEHELANLFRKLGHSAEVTSVSNDKGVDIWLGTDQGKEIVQCKAHKSPIGPNVVRELHGTMQHFGVQSGVLASTSGFTKGVNEYIKDKPIRLLNLDDILKMQEKTNEDI